MRKTYRQGRHVQGRHVMVCVGVQPTAARRRQNGGVRAEIIERDFCGNIPVKRYRAVWECPLDAYLDHKAISCSEHKAGLLFRGAYRRALVNRRAAYGPNDRMLRKAYQTLSSHTRGAIIDICGHDLPARDIAKLERLKKGLRQLANLGKAFARELFDDD